MTNACFLEMAPQLSGPRWIRFAYSVAICGLTGCGRGNSAPAVVSIRDSANVRIMSYPRSTWIEGMPTLALSADAALTLGDSGADGHGLFRVRSVGRLRNGDLVVANGGASQILVFDSGGRLRRTIGRSGAGPGEFTNLVFSQVMSDSIWAYDLLQRRVSVFTPNGAVVRTVPADIGFVRHVFPDGVQIATYPELPQLVPGILRGTAAVLRVLPGARTPDTVGRFPDSELFFDPEANFVGEPRPFGKKLLFAFDDSTIYVSTGDHPEIRCYSTQGVLVRILTVEVPGRRVSSGDFEAYMAPLLSSSAAGSRRSALERMADKQPYPETMPPFGGLLAGAEGELWVEDYRARPDSVHRWRAIAHSGRTIGVLELPSRFTALSFGTSWVAGVRLDDADGEHVELYRFLRN